jgi:hypothetical protein
MPERGRGTSSPPHPKPTPLEGKTHWHNAFSYGGEVAQTLVCSASKQEEQTEVCATPIGQPAYDNPHN